MGGSETCRLLAEQMLADAQREPKRNKLLLRTAHTWLELAKTLKRTEAVTGGPACYFNNENKSAPTRADRGRD